MRQGREEPASVYRPAGFSVFVPDAPTLSLVLQRFGLSVGPVGRPGLVVLIPYSGLHNYARVCICIRLCYVNRVEVCPSVRVMFAPSALLQVRCAGAQLEGSHVSSGRTDRGMTCWTLTELGSGYFSV